MASASASTSSVITLPAAVIAPAPDPHRRHQRRIGANESAGSDSGPVLGEPVVIAGDRAGADICPSAHLGVAEIGQVIGLRPRAQLGRLQLHEIADMGGRSDHGSRPYARERPDQAVLAHRASFQVAECADRRSTRNRDAGTEHHVRAERDVLGKDRVGAQEHGRRIGHGDPGLHRGFAKTLLHHRLGCRQLRAGVDPGQFLGGRLDGRHRDLLQPGQRHAIRQVILTLSVVRPHSLKPAGHVGGGGAQHAGVTEALRPFRR